MPASSTHPSLRPRLPLLIYVLAAGTFLMGTTEFVVAGLLPEMAADLQVGVAQAGLTITVFAVGMIVGAPGMAVLTLRLPRRLTLTLALVVFAIGHVVAALGADLPVLLAARFVTALATGAFWAVAAVVASRAAGPAGSSRALGIVLGGGMLATVVGVPLGALGGQLVGWRGPFWALAALAAVGAVVVARCVPDDDPSDPAPSVRAEVAALRSGRLWLALATCTMVTGGALSVYSFVSPLLTGRTGLPASAVPLALVLFGAAALLGSVLGGRWGDARPYRTALVAAGTTVLATVGLSVASTEPGATLVLFTLLGLTGLSANPVLVACAVRFGGGAPTLASAMATSAFNAGTAVGTWIAGRTLESSLGVLGPTLVGIAGAVLVFVPLVALARRDRPVRAVATAASTDDAVPARAR